MEAALRESLVLDPALLRSQVSAINAQASEAKQREQSELDRALKQSELDLIEQTLA